MGQKGKHMLNTLQTQCKHVANTQRGPGGETRGKHVATTWQTRVHVATCGKHLANRCTRGKYVAITWCVPGLVFYTLLPLFHEIKACSTIQPVALQRFIHSTEALLCMTLTNYSNRCHSAGYGLIGLQVEMRQYARVDQECPLGVCGTRDESIRSLRVVHKVRTWISLALMFEVHFDVLSLAVTGWGRNLS